jgi:kynurenine formamidase
VDDLNETLAFQETSIKPGDIMVLHTGWMNNYRNADEEYRRNAYTPAGLRTPGLAPGDDMLEFLWDLHLAGAAADNTSLEQVPQDSDPQFKLHFTLLPLWGMAVGESWSVHDLAEDCANDRQYSFLLVSVPLNVRGGLGSPANAVAIK